MKKLFLYLLMLVSMSANAQVINEGFWVMEKSSNGPMNPRFYIYGTNKYDKDLGEIKIYMVNYNLVCHIQMEHTTRLPLTARIRVIYEYQRKSDHQVVKKEQIRNCKISATQKGGLAWACLDPYPTDVYKSVSLKFEVLQILLNNTELYIDATTNN